MKPRKSNGYTKILLLCILSVFLLQGAFGQTEIYIPEGICDARSIDLSSHRLQLSGNWKFFPNQLIAPREIPFEKHSLLAVPSTWDESGISFGTYALEVVVSAPNEKLALEIPQLYNSYRLFINDSLIASNGVPASTREESKPQWKPQPVIFSTKTDTVRVVLHLSNFHHFKGGIREPIYLGNAADIQSHFNSTYYSTLAEVGLISLLGLAFFYLWLFRNPKKISLYFSLFCIAWSIRELFSDVYPISQLFPDINWFLLVRTEYVALFLIMIFAIQFVNRLFSDISSKVFKYLLISLNIIFIIFTIGSPVSMFSRWLPLYLMTAMITILYAAVVIVRALILDKSGAWALILGMLLMVFTATYDLVAYKGILVNNVMIANIGYCLILLCCATGLLQHLEIIGSSHDSDNKLRYQDLYR